MNVFEENQMILRNFKRKICRFFFKRRIARYHRKTLSFESEAIDSILVLTNDAYNHQVIPLELSEFLGIAQEKITAVLFQEKKIKNQQVNHLLTFNEFNWVGKLKTAAKETYLNTKYDLLINYCADDDLLTNLFSLQCESSFNIAFKHHHKKLNDLIVDCNKEDLTTFHNEVKKYLLIFNKEIGDSVG